MARQGGKSCNGRVAQPTQAQGLALETVRLVTYSTQTLLPGERAKMGRCKSPGQSLICLLLESIGRDTATLAAARDANQRPACTLCNQETLLRCRVWFPLSIHSGGLLPGKNTGDGDRASKGPGIHLIRRSEQRLLRT